MMSSLLQDLRSGSRLLTKDAGFTFVALVSLALGIGANTALFSVTNSVLLRPLPFKDPGRLVRLWMVDKDMSRLPATEPDFLGWQRHSRSFEQLAAFDSGTSYNLTGQGKPTRLKGARVTTGFFDLLGVSPMLGRTFTPDDGQPEHTRAVVLSHGLWKNLFGSDTNLTGKALILNGEKYQVMGVMPDGFRFPEWAELWAPLDIMGDAMPRSKPSLAVIGRIRGDVTEADARAEMDAIVPRLGPEQPADNNALGVRLVPMFEEVVAGIRPALRMLMGAVAFLLLIACANVASLLLARSAGRNTELGVRTALGAGRFRVIRQLLTESVLLALAGGGAGLLSALWVVDLLKAQAPGTIPRLHELRVDARVLLFTFAISTLSGLLFGLPPALRAGRKEVSESLKARARGFSQGSFTSRIRNLLVVVEIALTLVLCTGAGLMMRSLAALSSVDPGFNPRNAVVFGLSLPGSRYTNDQQRLALSLRLRERIRKMPGVEAVAATNSGPPLGSSTDSAYFQAAGSSIATAQQADVRSITPGYFRVLHVPLLRGSDFTELDLSGTSNVVIVNQTLARRNWPSGDPVGKQIRLGSARYTIVGVAGNVRESRLEREPTQEIYFPGIQQSMFFLVRTISAPPGAGEFENGVQAVDKDLPIYEFKTMEQVLSRYSAGRRFQMLLLSLFAAVALTLAMIGVYSVMTYSVSGRAGEMGIRMALGARRQEILKLVAGHAVGLLLAGTLAGIISALAISRFLRSLLFGIGPMDAATYAAVSLLVLVSGFVAGYLPARRATRIDPVTALRYE